MGILIVLALFFCVGKLLSAISRHASQRRMERIEAEQAAQREEQRRMIMYQREQAKRQAEHEKALAKAKKEREALRKEQARQAAALAKHEEQIAQLHYKVAQIEEDLPLLRSQLDYQSAQMNNLQDTLHKQRIAVEFDETAIRVSGTHSAVKGKDYEAHKAAVEKTQAKIIKLQSAIRATEKKIAKAEFDKAQAQRKLA